MSRESQVFEYTTREINRTSELAIRRINGAVGFYTNARLLFAEHGGNPDDFQYSRQAATISSDLYEGVVDFIPWDIYRTPERNIIRLTVGEKALQSYVITSGRHGFSELRNSHAETEPRAIHYIRQVTHDLGNDNEGRLCGSVYLGDYSLFSLDALATNQENGGAIELVPSTELYSLDSE